MSFALFARTKEAKYLHALEHSLFNHLLGAADREGKDFGYYQPNYGKRVLATAANLYKCCRYRGYSMVSQLPGCVYCAEPDVLIPMIYTDSSMEDAWWQVRQETKYPSTGTISFHIQVKQKCNRQLWLRIPPRCKGSVWVNEAEAKITEKDGYLRIPCDWTPGNHEIQLVLTPVLTETYADIQGEKYVSYQCGCLLLAAEVEENQLAGLQIDPQQIVACDKPANGALVEYRCGNLRIVDYASAGRTPGSAFTVWKCCKG